MTDLISSGHYLWLPRITVLQAVMFFAFFAFHYLPGTTLPEWQDLLFQPAQADSVCQEDTLRTTSIYQFPAAGMHSGITWMSFPTLRAPDIVNGRHQNNISNLLSDVFLMDRLESIRYKRPGGNLEFIENISWVWCGHLHDLDPRQGYKFLMNRAHVRPFFVLVPGIQPPEDLPVTIKAKIAANQPNPDNENWLGYFINRTVKARDAFGGMLENLWSIQTQNWTMVRLQKVPGSPWIVDYHEGKEPTLSYGDMVIVKCFSDAQFTWDANAGSQLPIEKELPSHYIYEEKADYIPFFVELDAGELPKEVAIYVDDVCKGAAVVTDSLTEIPGYILDGTNPNGEIEIRAYYADKAAVDNIPVYLVWNPESGTYDHKPLKLSNKNYYYKLKLNSNDNGTPAISEPAINIYPNPFNPSTTIKFSLDNPADIKLEIYNLKGQLVKCLARGMADKGLSSITWNGTDNSNRKVASGMYYSKLSYNGKSITKKMVLMK